MDKGGKMNNDDKYYISKFSSAQGYLQVDSIEKIASIKIRENSNYSSYRDLIEYIGSSNTRIKIKEAQGDFHGSGWVLEDEIDNRVLLIEHETGLEILYIAGSIASLIQLVPFVINGWKQISDIFNRNSRFDHRAKVEIRILDKDRSIVETKFIEIDEYIYKVLIEKYFELNEKVDKLEKEVFDLKKGKKVKEKETIAKSPRKKI